MQDVRDMDMTAASLSYGPGFMSGGPVGVLMHDISAVMFHTTWPEFSLIANEGCGLARPLPQSGTEGELQLL